MKTREMKRILVTGAVGQIGSELTLALRKKYGADNVVATGRKTPPSEALKNSGPFYFIDVNKRESIVAVVKKHDIDTVYHMAAILSVVGEQNPQLAWHVNMDGLYMVLEVARGVVPFLISDVVRVTLLMLFPILTLWLVHMIA